MFLRNLISQRSEEGPRRSYSQLVKFQPIATAPQTPPATAGTRKLIRHAATVSQRVQRAGNGFGAIYTQNGFIVVQKARATVVQFCKRVSWTSLLPPSSCVKKRQYALLD